MNIWHIALKARSFGGILKTSKWHRHSCFKVTLRLKQYPSTVLRWSCHSLLLTCLGHSLFRKACKKARVSGGINELDLQWVGLRKQFYLWSHFISLQYPFHMSSMALWASEYLYSTYRTWDSSFSVFEQQGRRQVVFEKHACFGTVTMKSRNYQLAFISKISVWICWSLFYTYTMRRYIQCWQLSHLKKMLTILHFKKTCEMAEAIRAVVYFLQLCAYKLPESYWLNFQILV